MNSWFFGLFREIVKDTQARSAAVVEVQGKDVYCFALLIPTPCRRTDLEIL